MLVGDRLVGVLTTVSFRSGKRFTTEDGRLFGGFAAIAGVVVDMTQRLADLEEAPVLAGTPGSSAESRIAASVANIARVNPGGLDDVLGLLRAVENLLGAS